MSIPLTTRILDSPVFRPRRRARRAVGRGGLLLPLTSALTLFASASLLFLIQPMIGKMILPLMGGTPAVWITCMVFFQSILLAGYSYAHASTTWLGGRGQRILHVCLLISALLVLPIAVDRTWFHAGGADPTTHVLAILLMSVGLPFFVVSAHAPLLQRWFADTGHHAAGDPYFLYGASNLGSLLALLGYPALVEPHLRLVTQGRLWAVGYVALVSATVGCAALTSWSTAVSASGRARRCRGRCPLRRHRAGGWGGSHAAAARAGSHGR